MHSNVSYKRVKSSKGKLPDYVRCKHCRKPLGRDALTCTRCAVQGCGSHASKSKDRR